MRRPDAREYRGLDVSPMGNKEAQPAKYDAEFGADFGADFSVDLGSDPRDRSLAERVNKEQ
ncbi:MAG TPA: hypothetical protein VNT75_25450 [Symbiobacteriaceae bacterium]|nr:hypothetical protein [Symbiobacteriaceae bacterium]